MSSEEAAFLAAIAANPDDRLPRYVYSDWLEDRGDERAHWVRDDALWPHMGPCAENPIPRLIGRLEAEVQRAADFEYAEGQWITQALENEVEQLVGLLGRCGPGIVPLLLDRIDRDDPWPRIAQDLCLPFPHELLAAAGRLSREVEHGRPEVAVAAGSLLVRAAELDPDRLDGVLMDVWRSGDPRTERALAALAHARGVVADRIADSWIGHLSDDLTQPDVDDFPLFLAKLGCLANMTEVSPAAHPLFEAALRDIRPQVSEVAAFALGRLGEQVTKQAAEKALRDCTADNRTSAFALVRQAWPDWVPRLVGLLAESDLPPQTRLGAIECLAHAGEADWSQVMPALRKGLKATDEQVRHVAQVALAGAKVPLSLVLPHVREFRKEKVPAVRVAGLWAFLTRHDDTPPYTAHFEEAVFALADPRPEVRGEVERRLRNSDVELDVSEHARQFARRSNAELRAAAARVLGLFQASEEANFPVLLDLLDDRELTVRRAAAQAIGECLAPNASGVYKPLKKALRDPDAIIRGSAAKAFGQLGRRAAELLDELMALTHDSVAIVRGGALFAVAMIDYEDEEVKRVVFAGLKDESEYVVQCVLEGLQGGTTVLEGKKLLTRLMGLAKHPTPRTRVLAFDALAEFDTDDLTSEAIQLGIDGLRDPDIKVAEAAFHFLPATEEVNSRALPEFFRLYASPGCSIRYDVGWMIRGLPDAPDQFARLLEHPDPAVRLDAGEWLERLMSDGPGEPNRRSEVAPVLVPRLGRVLTTERGELLARAIALVALIGPPAAEFFPLVAPHCRHDNPVVRVAALAAVGRFGAVARVLTPDLQTILFGDGNEKDRAAAAASLVSLSSLEPHLLPDLIDRLHQGPEEIRVAIADRLILHPELGAAIIPALFARLEDPEENEDIYNAAADALGELGEVMQPHVPRLAQQLLPDVGHNSPVSVLQALGSLGEVAVAAIPAIHRLLESTEDEEDGYEAVMALALIPDEGSDRARALVTGLRHPEEKVRLQASYYLAEFDDEAAEVIPELCRALDSVRTDQTAHTDIRDDDDEVSGGDYSHDLTDLECDIREDLLKLLGKLGQKAVGAIPTIVRYIDDEVEDVRIAAVEALVAIGPRARDALRKATRSEYEDVAEIAEEALDELDDRR